MQRVEQFCGGNSKTICYGEEIKKDITDDVEKMIKDDLKVRAAAKFLADNAKEK